MLWKCCTQYASKSRKLSSGHRTGKGQFSFQSQRRAMPKNVQTTAQLHSSHTLTWHPTPVLLPGKSHGRRSLVGCSPWGHEESDMTERLHFSLFTFMHWRRKWQPTPVFLLGESQGRRSLVGCRLWGCTEPDTTEAIQQQQQQLQCKVTEVGIASVFSWQRHQSLK